jgi:hypothetical protein
MVDDLGTIEKVVRMRERLEDAEPGAGVVMLKNAMPEVAVESAKAVIAIVQNQKECVEALLTSARNKLLSSQVSRHAAKSGEEIDEAEQHMLLYTQQLLERTTVGSSSTEAAVLHYTPPPKKDPDEDTDDRVYGPEWPIKYGAAVLHQMLAQGGVQEDATSVDWATIAIIQALYRFYSGTVLPEYERAHEQLENARHIGVANQELQQQMDERELQERIRNINGASYFGDDDEFDA